MAGKGPPNFSASSPLLPSQFCPAGNLQNPVTAIQATGAGGGAPSELQQYATGSGLAVATFGANEVTNIGAGQTGGNGKTLLPQDTWHAQYHVTWVRGRHQSKAGVDLQRMKMAAFNSRNSGGQFVFDRTYTQGPHPAVTAINSGNAFASFLLGAPISGSIETTPFMACSSVTMPPISRTTGGSRAA